MGAVFDATYTYRYTLWREWGATTSRVAFVMLNPSTGDAQQDDPTIRKCIQFAKAWGFGSLEVVNLFAYRTPHPQVLRQVPLPIGADNDRYLQAAADRADQVILAWGNWGTLFQRDQIVLEILSGRSRLHCLGVNRSGQPRHPLYLGRELRPITFKIDFCEERFAAPQRGF